MKKLTALLLSCMMIGCAFVSCGNDDDDSSSKATTTNSSSEADMDTTEDKTDEEETTEEKTTEEKTTEAKTEEKTTEGSAEGGNLETEILGKWQGESLEAEGQVMTDLLGLPLHALVHIEFKNGGKCVISSAVDKETAESTWSVTGTNKITVMFPGEEGEEADPMIAELKNGKLVCEVDEDDMKGSITLAKVDTYSEFDMEKFKEDFAGALGGALGGEAATTTAAN